METFKYSGVSCPVCGKAFNEKDNIVVCPDCGAPYHRSCYDEKGECIFKDKHSETFEFDCEKSLICPFCLTKNDKDAQLCKSCGNKITMDNEIKDGKVIDPQEDSKDQSDPIEVLQKELEIDPMAGVQSDEQLDGVTAEEMATFVKSNTPYYMKVFKNAKEKLPQKFNLCAFIFSGAWFLFRKQYKIGAIITSVMLALVSASIIVSNFLTPKLIQIFSMAGINTETNMFSPQAAQSLMSQINLLSISDRLLFSIPTFIFIAELIIMIISGLKANKFYLKHCIKTIKAIKAEQILPAEKEKLMQEKGGINRGIAFSVILTYFIIKNFLPYVSF